MNSRNDTGEKIEELQILETQLQNILAQKQPMQSELSEIENALQEVNAQTEIYKIVAGLLIKVDFPTTKKELEEKKNRLVMKINSIEKQEAIVTKNASSLRDEVHKSLRTSKLDK